MIAKENRKKIFKLIITILILISFVWILPTLIFRFIHTEETQVIFKESSVTKNVYNIADLFEFVYETVSEKYEIDINNIKNGTVYDETCEVNIKINDFLPSNNYLIQVYREDEKIYEINNIQEDNFKINIELREGINNLKINISENNSLGETYLLYVYYVKPYEKQFLDEYEIDGTQTHYRDGSMEDFEQSYDLITYGGNKYVRIEFIWQCIYKNGKYDFSKYDEYVNKIDKNKTKILALVNGFGSLAGSDKKINNDEELENFIEFVDEIIAKYPYITQYEILNEVNQEAEYKGAYLTREESIWYVKILEKLIGKYKDKEFIVAGTSVPTEEYADELGTLITSQEFYTNILNSNIDTYTSSFAIHPYCNNQNNNYYLHEVMDSHKELFNQYGGFIKIYITEYGFTVYRNEENREEIQADKLIQQSTILDQYNPKAKIQYNFWNVGNNELITGHNYGVVNNNYTPKLSFYALKNYYENTNGAEYIGTVNLAESLEAHVYNKDGKPKIIAWAKDANNTIHINYSNFVARDVYGNKIENTDSVLKITSSPVYIDNISNQYFYEAISNTATKKYDEFIKKFSIELENIEGINDKIEELKQYMASIPENESQEAVIQKMSEHFALGNTILNAYKNGNLDVEYVKLSSMLDMLNDIGNSYEDLVTVSATERKPYFTATEGLIKKAESTINNNADLKIIYPTKILDFAKELGEKAEYINSLEEENDIKTGLIVSNSLHAYYLADWANEFAQIYVEDHIKANPVTVSYSNVDAYTNQDVIATLNITSDSKVTNNAGKNTYTFTQNGEFTFEYERRGQTCTMTATVSNIDKESPNISNVINGKIYLDTVKPIITDDNIQSVEVLFNNEVIQYEIGMEFSTEGIYNITATDKAGNITKVEFYIVEDATQDYVIRDNYILNVRQQTTVEKFENKFNITEGEEYDIIRDTTHLTSIVATGDTLILDNGARYTIIVAGDINGDGRVANYDLSALRRYILRLRDFNELESIAADINIDGKTLGVKDYSRMRIEILGKY